MPLLFELVDIRQHFTVPTQICDIFSQVFQCCLHTGDPFLHLLNSLVAVLREQCQTFSDATV